MITHSRLVFVLAAAVYFTVGGTSGSSPRRAIVIIDVTNEQYVMEKSASAVWNSESVLQNIEWLVGGSDDAPSWDAIFTCQNWIYSKEDSAISPNWRGGVPGSTGADLVPQLAKLRDAANGTASQWHFIGKPVYSCFFNTVFEHALLTMKIDELYFAGINTEQCVYSSIFDSFRLGAVDNFFLIADACSSGFGEAGHKLGLEMLNHNICNPSAPVSDCRHIINSTDLKRKHDFHHIAV